MFQQVFIPRTLNEVIDYERDIDRATQHDTQDVSLILIRISPLSDSPVVSLGLQMVYSELTGLKGDFSGPQAEPELLQRKTTQEKAASEADEDEEEDESDDEEEEDEDEEEEEEYVHPKDRVTEEDEVDRKAHKKAVKAERKEKRENKIKKHVKKRKEKEGKV